MEDADRVGNDLDLIERGPDLGRITGVDGGPEVVNRCGRRVEDPLECGPDERPDVGQRRVVERLLSLRNRGLQRIERREGSLVLGRARLGDECRVEGGQRIEVILDVDRVVIELADRAADPTAGRGKHEKQRQSGDQGSGTAWTGKHGRDRVAGSAAARRSAHRYHAGMAVRRPRIVVTVQSPQHAANEEVAWRKNDRYFEAVERHGGEVIVLDEDSAAGVRAAAFGAMDGLLLSGGADLDPALYGEEPLPTTVVEPGRDALEQAAFAAAEERQVPVFGVCRGMQAVNVFRGGSLLQDIEGHTSQAYPAPEATSHDLEVESGTRLAAVVGEGPATVNTYHHQAIRPDQVGHGLRISGYSPHPEGDLVEAFEDEDPGRWLMAVQSHPERTEFTSPEFERLWASFVEAAREFASRGPG